MRRTTVTGSTHWSAERLPLWRLVPVLLCLLLPLPGFAQASVPSPPLVPAPSAPEAAPSKSEEEDPYGGYDDESEDDEPEDGAPRDEIIPREGSFSGGGRRDGLRILTESLLGVTVGVVGLAPGAFLGFVLAASEDSDSSLGLFEVASLGFVGVTFGAALGVYGGGSLLGGEGRFGRTLIGAFLGALAGGLLAIPAALIVDGGWIVPAIALPVAGAIIAYESAHEQEQERKAAVAGTRMELVPVISVRPSGGLVAGLAGRF